MSYETKQKKKTILCPQNMFDDIFTQLGCKQSPAWMRTGIIGPFQILLQQNFNLRRKVAFLSKLFLLRRRNACCIYMSSCIVYILIQLIQPIFWYCSQDLCHGYYSPPYGYIFPLIFSSFFFLVITVYIQVFYFKFRISKVLLEDLELCHS